MRQSAVRILERLLRDRGIDPARVSCLDVGGTRKVWLELSPPKPPGRVRAAILRRLGAVFTRVRRPYEITENPLCGRIPGIRFLDSGFNADAIGTDADIAVDFLDESAVAPLEGRFDLVISFDTLEHVRDPRRFCRHLVRAVRPAGHVYVATVFAWPYHPSPEDFFRFSPEGLRTCCEGAGAHLLEYGWDEEGVSVYAWLRREGIAEGDPQ